MPSPLQPTQGSRHSLGPATGCLLLAVIVLLHAGLLGRSRWQADEYITVASMRQFGAPFLIGWYLHWSPRLWSDLLYMAYGTAVDRLHRPLAGTCMALLWSSLAAACLVPAGLGPSGTRMRRIFLGMAILCLFLVGHSVTGIFFWPAGGLSYLPTLAGCIWLFWCLADGAEGRWPAAAALALAAGSSEVGVFVALALGACVAMQRWRQGLRRSWWLAPGLMIAALDLGLVLHGRVGTIEILGSSSKYVHHAYASLWDALPLFLAEFTASGQRNMPVWAAARWGWRPGYSPP